MKIKLQPSSVTKLLAFPSNLCHVAFPILRKSLHSSLTFNVTWADVSDLAGICSTGNSETEKIDAGMAMYTWYTQAASKNYDQTH
jgi:hypothetical protein